MITVAVLNDSTLLTDAGIETIVAAVNDDFARTIVPAWQLDAHTFVQVPQGDPPPAGCRWLACVDDPDRSDALGYHDQTAEGLPFGKIFVRLTQQDSQTVSRVFSHEAVEQAVDPNLNRMAPIDGLSYIVEPGDPLALDSQGRDLGGVLLSGIALPDYYYRGGTRYDIDGHLTGPCPTSAKGGGTFLMSWDGQKWSTSMSAASPEENMAMLPKRGSRRHRRMLGAANWKRSTRWAKELGIEL